MKLDCDVIGDLLPLYTEGLTCEKSNELVEEHLRECESCTRRLQAMREPEPEIVHTAEPVKRIRRQMRKHTATVAALVGFGVLLILLVVLAIIGDAGGSGIMGYIFIAYLCVLPMGGFYGSLVLSKSQSKIKWFAPVLFGGCGPLLSVVLFGSSVFSGEFICIFVPSVLGLLCGVADQAARKLSPTSESQGSSRVKRWLRRHLPDIAALAVFAVVLVVLYRWSFTKDIWDDMYEYASYRVVIPLAGFVCSLLMGCTGNRTTWIAPFLFSNGMLLLWYLIHQRLEGLMYFSTTFIPSALGLLMGLLIRYFRVRWQAKKKQSE